MTHIITKLVHIWAPLLLFQVLSRQFPSPLFSKSNENKHKMAFDSHQK